MNLEEQVKAYRELGKKIDELEEQKKALGALIIEQMAEKTMQFSDCYVRRYSRLSIKLSVDEARNFQATQMEEVVDKDKIKALYQLGKIQQGVSEVEYFRVFPSKDKQTKKSEGLTVEEWMLPPS